MSKFSTYLEDIAVSVKAPGDAKDLADFDSVKRYVFDIMTASDKYFAKICKNDILCGSASHGIRLYKDDEFDVLMELKFHHYEDIELHGEHSHPGFMLMKFPPKCTNVLPYYLINNSENYLDRKELQKWLNGIFLDAFETFGTTVYCQRKYELSYIWNTVCHTVYAESETRTFKIDFVPAVKIIDEGYDNPTWHAIPKGIKGGPKNTNNFTFVYENRQEEQRILQEYGGKIVQSALCLLQALCESKKLPKLRCYHMVAVALHFLDENDITDSSPLCDVFLDLLSDLSDYLTDGYLPSFWEENFNLFGNIKSEDLEHYQLEIIDAYNILSTYTHQAKLSYTRCLSHFK